MVAGASGGIGEAVARRLAERGLRVICAGRNLSRLETLAGELGGTALALQLDVTNKESVESLQERLPDSWRAIDILVANAGHDIGGRRRFDEGSVEDWAAIIDTNVTGMIRVCHAVIPGMLARGRGHVVTLGSIAGLKVYRDGSIYNASKFAVRAFSEALRADYAETDIRITEILPGMVRTNFAATRHSGDEAKAEAFYDSFPHCMEPDDIARAILFALEQPTSVTIAQMVILPTREA